MLGLDSAEVAFYRGNDFRPRSGIVMNNLGRRMVKILDLDDGTMHKRHVDQFRYVDDGQLSFEPDVPNGVSDNPIVDVSVNEIQQSEPRRSTRLLSKPVRNYKNPEFHSSCGGCGDCNTDST